MASPAPAPAPSSSSASSEEIVKYYYPTKDLTAKPKRQNIYKGFEHKLFSLSWVVVPALFLAFSVLKLTNSESFGEVYWKAYRLAEGVVKAHRGNSANYLLISVAAVVVLSVLLIVSLFVGKRKKDVYLVDFSTFQAPEDMLVTVPWFQNRTSQVPKFNEENMKFQQAIAARSGLGDATAWPRCAIERLGNYTIGEARTEAELVFCQILDELFAKTGIKPHQIDILVVNCSLFNPTPSLAALVINKYKMRSNITSYNLGGMGCSAGVLAVDLTRELLQNHKDAWALVLSTENITLNWYWGNDKSKLVQNCIFRVGGAGILLTNKTNVNAKYQLEHTVRVCNAADDSSYKAIWEEGDAENIRGVSLVSAKYLLPAVGDALKKNMTLLGAKVLPLSEKLKYAGSQFSRKVLGSKSAPYTPNFRKAFDHFCIHAGGKAVIDGLQQSLNLTPYDVEPSRATLYQFGNTSSSSIWYELNFVERARGVKKGQKIWQLAFGAGIKCNSAVWKALRNIPKA